MIGLGRPQQDSKTMATNLTSAGAGVASSFNEATKLQYINLR